jgi:hypothetical protein
MPLATLLAWHTAAEVREGATWAEPSYVEREPLEEQEGDEGVRHEQQ